MHLCGTILKLYLTNLLFYNHLGFEYTKLVNFFTTLCKILQSRYDCFTNSIFIYKTSLVT